MLKILPKSEEEDAVLDFMHDSIILLEGKMQHKPIIPINDKTKEENVCRIYSNPQTFQRNNTNATNVNKSNPQSERSARIAPTHLFP